MKENMVKKIEEKVKELVEGKKQNIELHLYDYENGGRSIAEHKDIAGYQLNGDWVAVFDKESSSHIYKASEVQFIKVTTE